LHKLRVVRLLRQLLKSLKHQELQDLTSEFSGAPDADASNAKCHKLHAICYRTKHTLWQTLSSANRQPIPHATAQSASQTAPDKTSLPAALRGMNSLKCQPISEEETPQIPMSFKFCPHQRKKSKTELFSAMQFDPMSDGIAPSDVKCTHRCVPLSSPSSSSPAPRA